MRKRRILIAACLFPKRREWKPIGIGFKGLEANSLTTKVLVKERKWEFVNVGRFVALSSRNQKGQLTVTKTVP